MKRPNISKLIITAQSVLLLLCLGYLAVVLVRNYCLKMEAKRYAMITGTMDAARSFSRGYFWLYEIKQYESGANNGEKARTEGEFEPAGKSEGRFQIYYYMVDKSFPQGHLEIQQAYVDAYNDRMRWFSNHPERLDKNGELISTEKLKQAANSLTNSNSNPP